MNYFWVLVGLFMCLSSCTRGEDLRKESEERFNDIYIDQNNPVTTNYNYKPPPPPPALPPVVLPLPFQPYFPYFSPFPFHFPGFLPIPFYYPYPYGYGSDISDHHLDDRAAAAAAAASSSGLYRRRYSWY